MVQSDFLCCISLHACQYRLLLSASFCCVLIDLRKSFGNKQGSETKPTAYLQPLFGLLLALDRKNKRVCALLSNFQLVFLLFAVLWDICNVAPLERQFHLRLLVLGTFIALHLT